MHRTNRLSSLLDGVGLAGYELTPCQQLSAGQQRRAALARLGFGNAALWLLDEPLTALDDAGCALVRDLLARHRAARRRCVVRHAPVAAARPDAAACTRTCRVTQATFARAPSVGRAFIAQLQRDLTIAFRSRSELINPLMFYVMGISMFPLGVGPGRGAARRNCAGRVVGAGAVVDAAVARLAVPARLRRRHAGAARAERRSVVRRCAGESAGALAGDRVCR